MPLLVNIQDNFHLRWRRTCYALFLSCSDISIYQLLTFLGIWEETYQYYTAQDHCILHISDLSVPCTEDLSSSNRLPRASHLGGKVEKYAEKNALGVHPSSISNTKLMKFLLTFISKFYTGKDSKDIQDMNMLAVMFIFQKKITRICSQKHVGHTYMDSHLFDLSLMAFQ